MSDDLLARFAERIGPALNEGGVIALREEQRRVVLALVRELQAWRDPNGGYEAITKAAIETDAALKEAKP